MTRSASSILIASLFAAATLGCAPPRDSSEADEASVRVRTSSSGATRAARNSDDGEPRGGVFNLFDREKRYELAPGTNIAVRLTDSVDSETANVGTNVSGTVTSNVSTNGKVVIPAGSLVKGEVVEVQSAKRFGGQAMVAIAFTEVETPDGDDIPVEGRLDAYSKKQTGKDTATIAGSAAGGALLGEIIDGKPVEGAIVGGGIGTAVASRMGPEAVISAGREVVVRTTSGVSLAASSDL